MEVKIRSVAVGEGCALGNQERQRQDESKNLQNNQGALAAITG